jgi:hypothetical protein
MVGDHMGIRGAVGLLFCRIFQQLFLHGPSVHVNVQWCALRCQLCIFYFIIFDVFLPMLSSTFTVQVRADRPAHTQLSKKVAGEKMHIHVWCTYVFLDSLSDVLRRTFISTPFFSLVLTYFTRFLTITKSSITTTKFASHYKVRRSHYKRQQFARAENCKVQLLRAFARCAHHIPLDCIFKACDR